MKKKYNTLYELNLAQRRMARKSVAIEDEFLGIIKNPLSLFSSSTTVQKSNKSQKIATVKSEPVQKTEEGNVFSDILSLAISTMGSTSPLGMITKLLLPLLPTKKIGKSVAKNAGSIAVKVIIVNLAIWGIKQLRIKAKNRSKKKTTLK